MDKTKNEKAPGKQKPSLRPMPSLDFDETFKNDLERLKSVDSLDDMFDDNLELLEDSGENLMTTAELAAMNKSSGSASLSNDIKDVSSDKNAIKGGSTDKDSKQKAMNSKVSAHTTKDETPNIEKDAKLKSQSVEKDSKISKPPKAPASKEKDVSKNASKSSKTSSKSNVKSSKKGSISSLDECFSGSLQSRESVDLDETMQYQLKRLHSFDSLDDVFNDNVEILDELEGIDEEVDGDISKSKDTDKPHCKPKDDTKTSNKYEVHEDEKDKNNQNKKNEGNKSQEGEDYHLKVKTNLERLKKMAAEQRKKKEDSSKSNLKDDVCKETPNNDSKTTQEDKALETCDKDKATKVRPKSGDDIDYALKAKQDLQRLKDLIALKKKNQGAQISADTEKNKCQDEHTSSKSEQNKNKEKEPKEGGTIEKHKEGIVSERVNENTSENAKPAEEVDYQSKIKQDLQRLKDLVALKKKSKGDQSLTDDCHDKSEEAKNQSTDKPEDNNTSNKNLDSSLKPAAPKECQPQSKQDPPHLKEIVSQKQKNDDLELFSSSSKETTKDNKPKQLKKDVENLSEKATKDVNDVSVRGKSPEQIVIQSECSDQADYQSKGNPELKHLKEELPHKKKEKAHDDVKEKHEGGTTKHSEPHDKDVFKKEEVAHASSKDDKVFSKSKVEDDEVSGNKPTEKIDYHLKVKQDLERLKESMRKKNERKSSIETETAQGKNEPIDQVDAQSKVKSDLQRLKDLIAQKKADALKEKEERMKAEEKHQEELKEQERLKQLENEKEEDLKKQREEEKKLQMQKDEEERIRQQKELEERIEQQREQRRQLKEQKELEKKMQQEKEEEEKKRRQEEEEKMRQQREEERKLKRQKEEEEKIRQQKEEEAKILHQREEENGRLQQQKEQEDKIKQQEEQIRLLQEQIKLLTGQESQPLVEQKPSEYVKQVKKDNKISDQVESLKETKDQADGKRSVTNKQKEIENVSNAKRDADTASAKEKSKVTEVKEDEKKRSSSNFDKEKTDETSPQKDGKDETKPKKVTKKKPVKKKKKDPPILCLDECLARERADSTASLDLDDTVNSQLDKLKSFDDLDDVYIENYDALMKYELVDKSAVKGKASSSMK